MGSTGSAAGQNPWGERYAWTAQVAPRSAYRWATRSADLSGVFARGRAGLCDSIGVAPARRRGLSG
jgi:hypothetical protein